MFNCIIAGYTKPKQRKRETKMLRGYGDQIKFIDLRFKIWQVVGFSRGKAMVGYTKPQQRKKEESERLRREREDKSSLLILDLKEEKVVGWGELCWGKAMVAYTKPQQRKKEGSEMLREGRDQIKFIDLRFERRQVVRISKGRRMKAYASCLF